MSGEWVSLDCASFLEVITIYSVHILSHWIKINCKYRTILSKKIYEMISDAPFLQSRCRHDLK